MITSQLHMLAVLMLFLYVAVCIIFIFNVSITSKTSTPGLSLQQNYNFAMSDKLSKVLTAISDGISLTEVDLSNCGLTSLPIELSQLHHSLEVLNLGNNAMSDLPADFNQFRKLRILFFANNHFVRMPEVLGSMESLFMLSFKSNKLTAIDEQALSPTVGWLILTDNQLSSLPESIGQLKYLRKLMLSGNRLTDLPDSLQNCRELELIRIAANRFEKIPQWLLTMPKLSWIAMAGNPVVSQDAALTQIYKPINTIDWHDIVVEEKLGEGASGVVWRARWPNDERQGTHNDVTAVAVKLFKGESTSDGLPEDEMKATEVIDHANSIRVLGRLVNAPSLGLVLALIPPEYQILAGPPSFQSVTRDTYKPGTAFSVERVAFILQGVASFAAYIHDKHISHGDLYGHNTLVDNTTHHPLLSDFGAATFYEGLSRPGVVRASVDPLSLLPPLPPPSPSSNVGGSTGIGFDSLRAMEAIEVRAFGCMMEELLDRLQYNLSTATESTFQKSSEQISQELSDLRDRCFHEDVFQRPSFHDIVNTLNIVFS